jgi:hypothetical protein
VLQVLVSVSGTRNARLHTPTVNQPIGFLYVRNLTHTSTIESTWRHLKAFLNPCNRMKVNITWSTT